MHTCYIQSCKTLPSLYSWAGRFESDLVKKSLKTRFRVTWLIWRSRHCRKKKKKKKKKKQGVQRILFLRSVILDFVKLNLFAWMLPCVTQCTMWRLYFAFVVNCLQHLEILSEIWVMPGKLQFSGHHSYIISGIINKLIEKLMQHQSKSNHQTHYGVNN